MTTRTLRPATDEMRGAKSPQEQRDGAAGLPNRTKTGPQHKLHTTGEPNSMQTPVKRPELEQIYKDISSLANEQSHSLLVTITGMTGSGKSEALKAIREYAISLDRNFHIVSFDVPDLLTSHPSRGSRLNHILRRVAQRLEIKVSDLHDDGSGVATLNTLATRIADGLAASSDRRLLLTFDNADQNKDARALLRAAEDFLFTRLNEIKEQKVPPVMVVIASVQEIDWRFLFQEVKAITLKPFSLRLIQEQLGCTPSEAQKIKAAGAGVPGASQALWKQGRSTIVQKTAAELFDSVFKQFVEPFLPANDPILTKAIKATSLLSSEFDVLQFMEVVRDVSYMQGAYSAKGPAFYYSEIDRMFAFGFVRYNNEHGKYWMEANLGALLRLWNEYSVAEYKADVERVKRILKPNIAATEINPPVAGAALLETPDFASAAVNAGGSPPIFASSSRHSERIKAIKHVHEFIKKNSPSESQFGNPRFVGRRNEIEELAGYWCRQSDQNIDIVFLSGGAGSGKTTLLTEFLRLAKQAGEQYPASGLIVPVTDVIDLEFSAANRVGRVRWAILEALQSMLGPGDSRQGWTQEVADSFANYFSADDEYNWRRDELRAIDEDEERTKLALQRRGDLRFVKKKLDNAFYTACRTFAHQMGAPGSHRRIVLAFDTYDYPVRSGASASQFIAETAARLAGDYFIVIACRPPIELEKSDPYLKGRLTNYLPDDLRDQATIIDLDSDKARPTKNDIIRYYRQKPWYDQQPERAELMAEIIVKNHSLPVLLSLLEYFSKGPDPIGDLKTLLRLKDNAEEDSFKQTLMDGLFRNRSGPSPRTDRAHRWALMIMSVADLGVSKTLLDNILPSRTRRNSAAAVEHLDLDEDQDYPDPDEIWSAIGDFALMSFLDDSNNGEGIRTDNGPIQTSTLVKQVHDIQNQAVYRPYEYMPGIGNEPRIGSTPKQPVYKLHDYVSNLYNDYIAWRLAHAELPEDADQEEFRLVSQRANIARAILRYVFGLGSAERAKLMRAEPSETHAVRKNLWNYQILRSNMVYYGIRLAAILYNQPKTSVDRVGKYVTPNLPRHDPLTFKSDEMMAALPVGPSSSGRIELDALTTAHAVFSYLNGKVTRELSNYLEYGFAEMLTQEVRYYLYDQGGDMPLANLTLPIVDQDQQQGYNQFKEARELYYAALATWEYASGQYPLSDPWLNAPRTGNRDYLLTWRDSGEWHEISEKIKIAEREKSARSFQNQYGLWLYYAGYSERAHDAFQLLLPEVGDVNNRVDLLVRQARSAIANPRFESFDPTSGMRGTLCGLDAANAYLLHALSYANEASPEQTARIHYTYGSIKRQVERLEWDVVFQTQPDAVELPNHASWGALRHYYEALTRLKNAPALESRISFGRTLIGYASVLMMFGDSSAAADACDASITHLENLLLEPRVNDQIRERIGLALAHSYSARGEIARNEAERARVPQRAEALYLTAIDDYSEAIKKHGTDHREWNAILKAHLALCTFSREASLYGRKAPRRDPERLFDCIEEMLDAISLLMPKDKPNGYRRLARMLVMLIGLKVPDQPIRQFEPQEMDEPASTFLRTLKWNLQEYPPNGEHLARQSYISMQRGFKIATVVDDTFNKLVLTSDTVRLLARYANAQQAQDFFSLREEELFSEPTSFSHLLTEYRAQRMQGLCRIEIGRAQLREATAAKVQIPAAAVDNLLKGFLILRVRSVHDREQLRNSVAGLREELRSALKAQLPGSADQLAVLYGRFKSVELGRPWSRLLRWMSLRLNEELT